MLLSSALLAVISLSIFDFSWLVGFLFNFLNFVWSSRIFCSFESLLIISSALLAVIQNYKISSMTIKICNEICIYIYIYIVEFTHYIMCVCIWERERDTEKKTIYIYIYREREGQAINKTKSYCQTDVTRLLMSFLSLPNRKWSEFDPHRVFHHRDLVPEKWSSEIQGHAVDLQFFFPSFQEEDES